MLLKTDQIILTITKDKNIDFKNKRKKEIDFTNNKRKKNVNFAKK